MPKAKPKSDIRINDPDAPASHRQKICLARLGAVPSPFTIRGMTMGHASAWIDQLSSPNNVSKEFVRMDMNVQNNGAVAPDAVIMDLTGNPTPFDDGKRPASKTLSRLHDDIVFDICGYLTNSAVPMTTVDIASAFFNDDHRVDTTTINNALNRAAKTPTSLFYKEIRMFIASGKLAKPNFGKPPSWYMTFFPASAKALVVKKPLETIGKSDTKFDVVSDDVDELLQDIASRPGMKKRATLLRDKLATGVVAVAQERTQISHDIAELKNQMADMFRLISHDKNPPAKSLDLDILMKRRWNGIQRRWRYHVIRKSTGIVVSHFQNHTDQACLLHA